MKAIFFLIPILVVMSGCATPYQPDSFTGGFSETQLGENIFQVSFQGNAYIGGEKVSDFSLLRSAELALEHGFPYFVVVEIVLYALVILIWPIIIWSALHSNSVILVRRIDA